MKIDVVFPMFNQLETSKRCLLSLHKAQNEHGSEHDYRMIFVDNGSTDGTQEWVRGAAREQDVIIVNRQNEFVSHAWNQGLTMSSAEIVVITNNDLEFCSGFLDRLVHPFVNAGEIPLASVPVLYDDYDEWMSNRARFWPLEGYNRITTRFIGCCFALTRQCIDTVGMFDPGLKVYYQDWDYEDRMLRYHRESVALALQASVWHMGAVSHTPESSAQAVQDKVTYEMLKRFHEGE